MKRRPAHWLMVAAVLLFLETQADEGLAERIEAGPDHALPAPIPRGTPPETEVDTTGIHYHLRRGDRTTARREMDRLRRENPGWQPSDELIALFEAAAMGAGPATRQERAWNCYTEARALVESGALEAARPKILCAEAHGQTRAFESLGWHLIHRGQPADAAALFALQHPRDAEAVHARAIALKTQGKHEAATDWLCDHAYLSSDLQTACIDDLLSLGWTHHQRQEWDSAQQRFRQAARRGGGRPARQGLAEACYAQAKMLVDQGTMDNVPSRIRCAEANGRRGAAESLAWGALDRDRPNAALTLFAMRRPPSEESLYGQHLALAAVDKHNRSVDLACDNAHRSLRLREGCADGLALRMADAFAMDDHPAVLDAARRLERTGAERPAVQPLVAWSMLRMGHRAEAAGLFDALLTVAPDNTAHGAGLILALEDDRAALQTARDRHPVVDRLLTEDTFARAWTRGQFDLATRLDMDHPALAGRDGVYVEAGFGRRQRRGDAGLSRLRALTPHVAVGGMAGDTRLKATLHAPRLESGSPASDAAFGGRPAPDIRPPRSEVDGVGGTILAYREEEGWNLWAAVGRTPAGFPVAPATVGEAGVRRLTDQWVLTGRLHRQPVEESLLSAAGARDSTSRRTWGRVIDEGGTVEVIRLLGERTAVGAAAEYARVEGRRVATNHRTALRTDLTWDVSEAPAAEISEHLRIGPFLAHQRYRKNLSHFTVGHGGYYSPRSATTAGLAVDWLTREGRPRLFRTRLALGYERAKEDSAPRFPLDRNDPETYAGTRTSGPVLQLQAEGIWLHASAWTAGGFLIHSNTRHHQELTVGILVRLHFSSRTAMFSDDLPLWHP